MTAGRSVLRKGYVRVTKPATGANGVSQQLGGSVAPNGALLDLVVVAGSNVQVPPPEGTAWSAVGYSDPNGVWAFNYTPASAGSFVVWVRLRLFPRTLAAQLLTVV